MRVLSLTLAALLVLSVFLTGCGGGTTDTGIPQDNGNPGGNHIPDISGIDDAFIHGPGMPAATPDDIQISQDGKIISNSYVKFFADSVNAQSWGRWFQLNNKGQKQWTLSNTSYSAPKAFLFGGNYWNGENDYLFSNEFTLPDGTDGVRVSFMARWKIAAGDTCSLIYSDADGPHLVATYTGGENASYPAWDKFYYELPPNFHGNDDLPSLEFYFVSNATTNDFGFAFDNLAVYQRQLEPPLNVNATDGLLFNTEITWNNNPAGSLIPEGYDIFRALDSGGGPGSYSYLNSVSYPTESYFDGSGVEDQVYWYKLVATKNGWPQSADSSEDDGYYSGL